MGINFNKNSFGKLTTAKLNQSKAAKNAGNIADTKASAAAKEGNSLNTSTLKSNQGLKIDSNTLFDKMGDVVPANDNPPVAKAKKKDGDKKTDDKKSDDKKTEKKEDESKLRIAARVILNIASGLVTPFGFPGFGDVLLPPPQDDPNIV